jgi:hypothetical protein
MEILKKLMTSAILFDGLKNFCCYNSYFCFQVHQSPTLTRPFALCPKSNINPPYCTVNIFYNVACFISAREKSCKNCSSRYRYFEIIVLHKFFKIQVTILFAKDKNPLSQSVSKYKKASNYIG